MGILLLLEMVTIILSIPYPSFLYKTFDIDRAAITIIIRYDNFAPLFFPIVSQF